MVKSVGEYIVDAAQEPWVWFHHDCCRFIDTWVDSKGWGSPMAAIGVEYNSQLTAIRRIQEGGGLVALWEYGMDEVGVPEVEHDPQEGDVAIISRLTDDGIHEACAIYDGDMWATLALNGLDCGPADVLKMWRP